MAPVGTVAVMLMNTLWKTNKHATPAPRALGEKKKSPVSEHAPGVVSQAERPLGVEVGNARAERGMRVERHCRHAAAAEHESEAAEPEAQHAQRVDHEVHAHRVRRALGPAEAGGHQGEARLHEHDQKGREQRPDKIERSVFHSCSYTGLAEWVPARATGTLEIRRVTAMKKQSRPSGKVIMEVRCHRRLRGCACSKPHTESGCHSGGSVDDAKRNVDWNKCRQKIRRDFSRLLKLSQYFKPPRPVQFARAKFLEGQLV